jgi:hypothetical protein
MFRDEWTGLKVGLIYSAYLRASTVKRYTASLIQGTRNFYEPQSRRGFEFGLMCQ